MRCNSCALYVFFFLHSNCSKNCLRGTVPVIRNLKPQSRFSSSCSQANVELNVVPFFRTEQSSNDYINSLYKQKHYNEALKAFEFLRKNTNYSLSSSSYAYLISACSSLRSLDNGRKVHSHILASKFQPDIILYNHILNMYGKCGPLKDARKNGKGHDAIELYYQMLKSGIMPDQFTFGSVVKACSGGGNVGLGRQLHAQVVKSEVGSHLIAQNALIAMYSKFDQIDDAWNVFSCIATMDLISWGSIIAGFSQLGYDREALFHFKEMLHHGDYQPNEYIIGSVFCACSGLLHSEYGKQIQFGLGRNVFAGCSLCDMYARCGFLDFARIIFNQIERPDLALWNAIIAGVANNSNVNEALSLFACMRHLRLIPDGLTVRSLLVLAPVLRHSVRCIFEIASMEMGNQVYCYIMKTGHVLDVYVMNGLICMYIKCGSLEIARELFDFIEDLNVVSWSSLIVGYA
ncbi:hypothetical protein EZV62_016940 [Acer yangbiense]|uniref:Pentacotripeptide-repeat region of PRORP domain-containing protein n=1 Tax=Acer yangbiense TaxID=1000413 RepID=A0A5C7HQ11_9ROSI|nr:hypothetical protein EZV62_016940 [Acer yangbiense]